MLVPRRVTLGACGGWRRVPTVVCAVAAVAQLLLRLIAGGEQDDVVDVVTLVEQHGGRKGRAGGGVREAERAQTAHPGSSEQPRTAARVWASSCGRQQRSPCVLCARTGDGEEDKRLFEKARSVCSDRG